MFVSLFVVLDSLNEYLRDIYKETRYSYHTEWPPDQPKSVVSNTMIHYKDKRTQRKLFDMSKHQKDASSVDEISSSHPSRIESIASIFESPGQKFILIEGAPGIGKSVLAKEIAYQWACGEILHEKMLFVLVVRNSILHDVDSINCNLISYFSCDFLSDSENEIAVNAVRKTRGQNMVFVIDGFDECPEKCGLRLFIEKLVKHEILPKSMVVITSRPHASISLRGCADQRIEILGFDRKEREKYIEQSLNEIPDKETEFKRYLKLQPVINNIMHVPLNLAVLLYLFKEDSMPETLTELNEQFVIHTIYRHLQKEHQVLALSVNINFKRLKDLPEYIVKSVNQLSKLAMNGLMKKQIVFSGNEVKAICTEIDKTSNGFGLLQTVCGYGGAGHAVSYHFIHLTMQEFLAAYYVSILPTEEQLNVVFHNLSNYVWLMYVGIVGVESESFIRYVEAKPLWIYSPTHKVLIFQCYLEARKFTQVPNNISSQFKDGNIKIKHERMDQYNMVSLVNFIIKCNVQLRSLNLHDCSITDEEVNVLQSFFNDHKENCNSVKQVCLSKNHITSLWKDYSNIKTDGLLIVPCLNLFSNNLQDSGIHEIFALLHYNTGLVQLDVSCNGLTSSGAIAISKCLRNNRTLQELNISQNELFDDGIIAISGSLKANYVLKILNIAGNKITNKGAANIANCIKLNKTLLDLNVSTNFIEKEGIMCILKANSENKVLQTLNCTFNLLSESDFIALAKCKNFVCTFNTSWNRIDFGNHCTHIPKIRTTICYEAGHDMQLCCHDHHCEEQYDPHNFDFYERVIYCCIKDVEELDLRRSHGWSEHVSQYLALTAKAIQDNKVLTKLHIRDFKIGDSEAQAISDCLKVDVLKELTMSDNRFNSGALKKVMEIIKCNKALRKLAISWKSSLSDDDIGSIAVCIEHNIRLQELFIVNTKITCSGMLMIARAIQVNSALVVLEVSWSRITDSGAQMLAEAIKFSSTLTVVDISHNKISDQGVEAIGDSLKYNKQLQEFNISCNKMTQNGTLYFLNCIATNVSLVKLGIQPAAENGIVWLKTIDMINCLEGNKTLQQIDGICDWSNLKWVDHSQNVIKQMVSANRFNQVFLYKAIISKFTHLIGNQANRAIIAVQIADQLMHNKVLRELHLLNFRLIKNIKLKLHKKADHCNEKQEYARSLEPESEKKRLPKLLDDVDIKAISRIIESIKVSTTLYTLIINHCQLQDGGAAIISDFIKRNTSIRKLDLSHNSITSNEAVEIFKAIKVNEAIQELNFSHNRLYDDGAAVVSDCLNHNSVLQHLNIKENNIHLEGIAIIIDSLMKNTALMELYMCIDDDGINDEISNKLTTMLKTNFNICTLSMAGFVPVEKCNILSFNKAILSSMYFNKSVTHLTIPWVSCLRPQRKVRQILCLLQNEVENINIQRRSQGIPVVSVNYFQLENSYEYHDYSHYSDSSDDY